jgi:hypothetical protein
MTRRARHGIRCDGLACRLGAVVTVVVATLHTTLTVVDMVRRVGRLVGVATVNRVGGVGGYGTITRTAAGDAPRPVRAAGS